MFEDFKISAFLAVNDCENNKRIVIHIELKLEDLCLLAELYDLAPHRSRVCLLRGSALASSWALPSNTAADRVVLSRRKALD